MTPDVTAAKLFLFVCLLAPFAVGQTLPVKQATDIHVGSSVDVPSPNQQYTIRCRTTKNDDLRISALLGKRTVALATLERSGEVFWRMDSKLAVINVFAGSALSFVELVPFPQARNSHIVEELLRKRIKAESPVGETYHEYIEAQGWLNETDLLIYVYINGAPKKGDDISADFCRGYIIDTEKLSLKSEVPRKVMSTTYGIHGCD